MEIYKREFMDFMVRSAVLTFGDFETKSGRRTPYFINTARYRTGAQMSRLGLFYADAIQARLESKVDVLFGPAYKGIPLVIATAMALESQHGRDVGWCFNRKEVKDHGEGGALVGHPLADGTRVLIVEDVTTAGTSIHETIPLMRAAADVVLAGLVVSVDRQERGSGDRPALEEIAETYSMPTFAIVTLDEIVAHLAGREIDGDVALTPQIAGRLEEYRAEYGAR